MCSSKTFSVVQFSIKQISACLDVKNQSRCALVIQFTTTTITTSTTTCTATCTTTISNIIIRLVHKSVQLPQWTRKNILRYCTV